MINNETLVTKDHREHSMTITREFSAPLNNVWRAFTDSAFLDKWWAPSPWRAETSHFDFRVGGYWLYAMVSPENEKHWGKMTYTGIEPQQSYHMEDAFCDENGDVNPALPVSKGQNVFTEIPGGTRVAWKVIYSSEEQLQKVVEMGMEEGIKMCMNQLAAILGKEA